MKNMFELARSHNQRRAVEILLKEGIVNYQDYLWSRRYHSTYSRSWLALFRRLQAAGYPVEYRPGKRGGVWTSAIVLHGEVK